MKNLKKLLSLGMAFALSVSMVPNALAVNETDAITFPGEEVIYYNTFPTGTTADLTEVKCDDYYFHGYNAALKADINNHVDYVSSGFNWPGYKYGMDGVSKSVFNGNTGVRPNGGGIANGTVILFDFRYKDASVTPKVPTATPDGLNSGVYRFSLDFVIAESSNNTDGFRLQANCMHGNSANNVWWVYGNKTAGTETVNWGVLKMSNSWTWSQKDIPITVGKLHHIDTIFDFDADKIYTFMDGVKYADISYSGAIKFLLLPSSSSISYMDNFLLTKMDSLYTPDMQAEVLKNDENGMELKFSDYIADMSGLEDITYTNTFTGETIETSVVGVADSLNTVKIVPETPLAFGQKYTLNADVDVPGLRGTSAIIETQDITPGVVESITVNDYNGEEKAFTKETVAEIDSLTFEFEPGEVAEDVLANLALYDNLGNPVELIVEPTFELNVAKAYIAKNLKGNAEYSLVLNGLEQPYQWNFKTGEGGLAMKPIKFYKADGVTPISLLDVSEGDTVKAKYEIVNTGESIGDLAFALTMGLYSKNGLIDFNYENVELTDGVDFYSTTVDFKVSRTDDLKAKGFIWESINTRKPLYNPVVTK